jgi:hypothetical protein
MDKPTSDKDVIRTTFRGLVCHLKPLKEIKTKQLRDKQIEWAINVYLDDWRPQELRQFMYKYLQSNL